MKNKVCNSKKTKKKTLILNLKIPTKIIQKKKTKTSNGNVIDKKKKKPSRSINVLTSNQVHKIILHPIRN